MCETPSGKASPGGGLTGAKAPRRLPERPRKANAWRVDQRTICTNP
ncbi:hypothetical protein KEH51_26260 [[Brevibacterium] frigoritolerans]|uniref:Uncharacterized protein n=1 Tax=Peribacillus frigoritolerans TaxID=450367 RepID=A0A941FK22_9BACI|nr:hypothetical protein [Peribacillus frigoritolerans]